MHGRPPNVAYFCAAFTAPENSVMQVRALLLSFLLFVFLIFNALKGCGVTRCVAGGSVSIMDVETAFAAAESSVLQVRPRFL